MGLTLTAPKHFRLCWVWARTPAVPSAPRGVQHRAVNVEYEEQESEPSSVCPVWPWMSHLTSLSLLRVEHGRSRVKMPWGGDDREDGGEGAVQRLQGEGWS